MTAYLQPGDIIHLAMPIDRRLRGGEIDAHVKKVNEEMAGFYGSLGVTVSMASYNSELTHPVVVAVIRSKEVLHHERSDPALP